MANLVSEGRETCAVLSFNCVSGSTRCVASSRAVEDDKEDAKATAAACAAVCAAVIHGEEYEADDEDDKEAEREVADRPAKEAM